jgi:site-specific DNA recombinase
MKAIILARVSSKEQEEGQSIPAQIRRLTEYTQKKNLVVEPEHICEITESSSKITRKQFDQIVALVNKSKEPMALVTDTVDRLQRSFRETPLLDELRRKGKLELHFLREGLVVNKESNSAQLLQWDIGVLFASSYVRQLSDNVKRSKDQSTKNGQWTAKAPFGYKNVTLPSGQKSIEIDQEQAPFVQKMFELYSTGVHSFQTITDEMTRLGMKNAKGGQLLSSRIEFTLKNPFYMGMMRMNEELYPHKYPPIISEELFDKVQDIIGGHHKSPIHYAGKELLFRGLIKCERCGCTVTGDIKKQKYVYYSCNNAKGVCNKVWVKEETLVAELLTYFDKIQLSDEQIHKIIAYLKQSYASEQAFFMHSQEALRKELDHIQARLSKLIDMHLDGGIDTETYRLKLDEYKKRQREITQEMKAHVNADESCLITAQTVLSLAQRSKDIFMSSKLAEKQQFLNFVFSNFRLDGEKLDLELKEPFNIFAKLGDQPEWLPEQDSNLRPND